MPEDPASLLLLGLLCVERQDTISLWPKPVKVELLSCVWSQCCQPTAVFTCVEPVEGRGAQWLRA